MPAYLMTWNPAKWEWEHSDSDVETIRKRGRKVGTWSCGNRTNLPIGSRLFFVRLGTKVKGIFGTARSTKDPYPDDHFTLRNRGAKYVKLVWDSLVPPYDDDALLTLDRLDTPALQRVHWTPQSSGILIPDDAAAELELLWARHLKGLRRAPPGVEQEVVTRRIAAEQGYAGSPAERRAIELHAMSVATAHLRRAGFEVEDVSATQPFDLKGTRGRTVLHVEVKGTRSQGDGVLLTAGEVNFARRHPDSVALYVVSGIKLDGPPAAPPASGGRLTVLNPWRVDVAGALTPTAFRYELDRSGSRRDSAS